MPFQAFISYSRTDYYAKDAIVAVFNAAGIQTWVDEQKIEFGDLWQQNIRQALKESACVVVLASPDAIVSQWVTEELVIAQNLRKPIFPILVRGDELPFGLNQLQYLDMREGGRKEDIEKFIQTLKSHFDPQTPPSVVPPKPSVSPTPSPQPAILKQPLAVRTMIVLLRLLETAADLISTNQDVGRACLLWFEDNEIFIAAATELYEDWELRLRLAKGKGFAGEVWQKNEKKYQVDYPKKIPASEMRSKWGFTEREIEIVQQMGTILSVPIYQQGKMVGILSLDNTQVIRNNKTNQTKIFAKAREIEDTISQLDISKPLPFYKYLDLQATIRTARLIPPYEVPVRATVYWLDSEKQELYAIAASEENISEWSTKDLRYKKDEGIIGFTWGRGYILFDNRQDTTPIPIQIETNLSDDKLEFFKNIQSIICVPVVGTVEGLIGVFAIDSPEPMEVSRLVENRVLISELARLAAKVLTAKEASS